MCAPEDDPGPVAPTSADDALIDELDSAMLRMGRIMASRHSVTDCSPEQLSMAHALVLRGLVQHGPAKMSDVASLLAVKPPAASAAVSALERDGHVVRTTDPEDRRITLVAVTDAGAEALRSAEMSRREAVRRYLSALTDEDVRSLIRILTTLIAALDEGRV